MRSFLVLAHVSAALVLAALTIPAHAQDRSITVTGRGEVNVAPDKATASFAVQQEAEIAADALDQASAATSAILATLDQEGIVVADIQTGSIRLNPRYNESLLSAGNQIIGYQAVNSIEVTVNDLGRIVRAGVGRPLGRID